MYSAKRYFSWRSILFLFVWLDVIRSAIYIDYQSLRHRLTIYYKFSFVFPLFYCFVSHHFFIFDSTPLPFDQALMTHTKSGVTSTDISVHKQSSKRHPSKSWQTIIVKHLSDEVSVFISIHYHTYCIWR